MEAFLNVSFYHINLQTINIQYLNLNILIYMVEKFWLLKLKKVLITNNNRRKRTFFFFLLFVTFSGYWTLPLVNTNTTSVLLWIYEYTRINCSKTDFLTIQTLCIKIYNSPALTCVEICETCSNEYMQYMTIYSTASQLLWQSRYCVSSKHLPLWHKELQYSLFMKR